MNNIIHKFLFQILKIQNWILKESIKFDRIKDSIHPQLASRIDVEKIFQDPLPDEMEDFVKYINVNVCAIYANSLGPKYTVEFSYEYGSFYCIFTQIYL
jgi:hypothetical protein